MVDQLGAAGLKPVVVSISGGDRVTFSKGVLHVPKRDLAGTLQVMFQSGRLKVAKGLAEAGLLVQELLNFRVRITATTHDTYGAWREGEHDDPVLAVALACWYGEWRGKRARCGHPSWTAAVTRVPAKRRHGRGPFSQDTAGESRCQTGR